MKRKKIATQKRTTRTMMTLEEAPRKLQKPMILSYVRASDRKKRVGPKLSNILFLLFAEAKQMAEAQLNQAKAMAGDKCSIQ